MTAVQLNFGTLAVIPVAAAVVVTPAQPGVAPLSITVTVLRRVTWWQYAWIPLLCGAGLAGLLLLTMLVFGLPDPYHDWQSRSDDSLGGPVKVRWLQVLSRPLYAASAWTFSGSWATNITAGATVIAAALAATGTVSELLPGVELGRFSLLIAVAGGITVAAPLVFGAVNYRFARIDPTTAGVSVITLPRGPVAVLRGRTRAALLGWRIPGYRYGGMVVFLRPGTHVRRRGGEPVPVTQAGDQLDRRNRVTVVGGQRMTVAGLGDVDWLRDRKAVLPDKGEWRYEAAIAVPASATITVSGGTVIPARAAPPAAAPPAPERPAREPRGLPDVLRKVRLLLKPEKRVLPPLPAVPPGAGPQAVADFTELPAQTDATLKAGAALSVPAGATIAVSASSTSPDEAFQILAVPGATDIAVFAGQSIRIDPWVTMAAGDVTMQPAVPPPPARVIWPPRAHALPGYRLRQGEPIYLAGGAKISFLGRASLRLPAGTRIAAPGAPPESPDRRSHLKPARRSYLKTATVFVIPHTGQVIASQMWSLLVASCLTLFGAGAELGILGVLAFSLSSAGLTVRVLSIAAAAVTAAVLWVYSVVSIRALADPKPGDSMNATSGTAFML